MLPATTARLMRGIAERLNTGLVPPPISVTVTGLVPEVLLATWADVDLWLLFALPIADTDMTVTYAHDGWDIEHRTVRCDIAGVPVVLKANREARARKPVAA